MKRFALSAWLLPALLSGAAGWGPAHVVQVPAVAGVAADEPGQQPVVEISKSCPKLRYLGRDATFEITVTNRGGGPAHDVLVTDLIPAGLDFHSADNDGTRDGGKIVWRLGTLKPGETRALKTNFRCNRIGTFRNSATVAYCVEAGDACEIEVKGVPAILLECVDDPDPIEINSNVTYTITVTNQGTAVDTGIAVECTLPQEQEFVSSAGPTEAKADGRKVTFAPLASLAPKANAVFKVTVKGVGEGDVRFTVQMKSDQMDSPVMETESTRIYR